MGIEGIEQNMGVASGIAVGLVYEGQIREIRLDNQIILSTPIDCDIVCLGPENAAPLIGLTALRRWNVCLDLPKEILSIS